MVLAYGILGDTAREFLSGQASSGLTFLGLEMGAPSVKALSLVKAEAPQLEATRTPGEVESFALFPGNHRLDGVEQTKLMFYRDQLVAVVVDFPLLSKTEARAMYEALDLKLSTAYGQGTEPLLNRSTPEKSWQLNGCTIGLCLKYDFAATGHRVSVLAVHDGLYKQLEERERQQLASSLGGNF
jgi:hypothetical protein